MDLDWPYVEDTMSYLHRSGRAVVWQSVKDWQWYGFWTAKAPVFRRDDGCHNIGPFPTLSAVREAAEQHMDRSDIERLRHESKKNTARDRQRDPLLA